MGTKFATAIVKGADSFKVGREAAAAALAKINGAKVDLSVVFASSAYNYQEVVKGIRSVTDNAPLIGCSSAGEFSEEQTSQGSVTCALISSDTHRFFTGTGKGLREDEVKCFADATAAFSSHSASKEFPHTSLIILADGLAGKGEEIALVTLGALGSDLRIAGGTAADDCKFKETFTFCDETVTSDSISTAIVFSKVPPALGIEHGHCPISVPFTVTRSEGNKVYELDGKPAIQVWLEATREPAKKYGIDVDTLWDYPDQLTKHTLIYEAGLFTGTGYKIRWSGLNPSTRDYLPFVCSIPQGTVLRVMEGSAESQIESSKNAARIALASMKGKKIAGALVFDCAVRGMILGSRFSEAIGEIKKALGDVPLIGCETYGELALEAGQLSGFHNTTTVVLLIPD